MVEKNVSNFFFFFFGQNTIKGKNDPTLHLLLFLEWFWAMYQKKDLLCLSTNHKANVPCAGNWNPSREHNQSVTELWPCGEERDAHT